MLPGEICIKSSKKVQFTPFARWHNLSVEPPQRSDCFFMQCDINALHTKKSRRGIVNCYLSVTDTTFIYATRTQRAATVFVSMLPGEQCNKTGEMARSITFARRHKYNVEQPQRVECYLCKRYRSCEHVRVS